MKAMNAILVDDEPDALEVLELMLKRSPFEVNILATANDARSAIQEIEKHSPDIVFLDIEMPLMNGFKVLEAFDRPSFKVVFVTSYDQYAIKAIKFSALDYLLKPVDEMELEGALDKVTQTMEQSDLRLDHLRKTNQKGEPFGQIVISSNREFNVLSLDEIVYIRGMGGGYSAFHMQNNKVKVATHPLNYFEGLLPQDRFFRVHRSFVANLQHVKSYIKGPKGHIILSNGEKLEVAQRRKKAFMETMKGFNGNSAR